MFFLEPCFQIFISLHFASEMALEPSINDMHLSAASLSRPKMLTKGVRAEGTSSPKGRGLIHFRIVASIDLRRRPNGPSDLCALTSSADQKRMRHLAATIGDDCSPTKSLCQVPHSQDSSCKLLVLQAHYDILCPSLQSS